MYVACNISVTYIQHLNTRLTALHHHHHHHLADTVACFFGIAWSLLQARKCVFQVYLNWLLQAIQCICINIQYQYLQMLFVGPVQIDEVPLLFAKLEVLGRATESAELFSCDEFINTKSANLTFNQPCALDANRSNCGIDCTRSVAINYQNTQSSCSKLENLFAPCI